jgi:hypothetical protein
MTTSRMSAVAIALSIAFGFIGGAGSTQGSTRDQNLSGTIASSKRMADGKEWTTTRTVRPQGAADGLRCPERIANRFDTLNVC